MPPNCHCHSLSGHPSLQGDSQKQVMVLVSHGQDIEKENSNDQTIKLKRPKPRIILM